MASRSTQSSWHQYVTIDLLFYCAKRTVLQPFFAWMLPLSLRAITIPYSHISFQATAAYASILTLVWVLAFWDQRIAFGLAREVDTSDEIVVITGGSRGLGQIIADFYRMKGVTVVVLDVKAPAKSQENGVQFYQCDLSNAQEVRFVSETIAKEVCISLQLLLAGSVRLTPFRSGSQQF
jgi:NADPH:quinone reductase-like Zn-dependent oxidoreductase